MPRRDTGIRGARAGRGSCTGNVRTVTSLLVPQSSLPGASTPQFSPTWSLTCNWPRSQRRSIQQVKCVPNREQWKLSFGRGLQLVLEGNWSRTVLWERRQTQVVGDPSQHRNHKADLVFHGDSYATDPNLFSTWTLFCTQNHFPWITSLLVCFIL